MGTSNRGHPHSLIFIAFAERHFPRFLLTNDVESNTLKDVVFTLKINFKESQDTNATDVILF